MRRGYRRAAFAVALALLALEASFAEGGSETTTPSGPFKITMVMPSVNPEPIKPDNPGYLEIERYTGYDLEVNWVPSTSYDQKIYALMAAGDLPMVFVARQAKAPIIVSSARAGMFWEVGKYLKEFPELSKMNPDINRNVSIDGKLYGMYTERAMARTGLIFRKDWADKLALGVPRTVDDMYAMARAFTLRDPDGNGQADTQGYSGAQDGEGYMGFNGLREVISWLGGPNNWDLVDSKFVPSHETPQHMEGLKLFKRLFDEKLINQDFAVVKQSREGINANKSGMTIANYDQPYNFYGEVKKLVPTAVFDIAPRITGPKGERLPGTAGHNGFYALPRKSVKTEAELRKILGFYDKLFDAPMQNLLAIGLEGRHYTVSGSNAVVTPEQAKLFADEINPLRQLKIDYFGRKALKPRQDPIREKGLFLYENNIEILVHDPTLPYVSDTMSKRGNELNKIIADANVKFVMGRIDEKGFKEAVELWRKSGGDAAIKEYMDEQAKALANK